MLTIHNTETWPFARIAQYGTQITAAMQKLADRFPNSITLKSLADDVISGRAQLWLILEGDEFRSFVLSEIKVTPATGHKSVVLTSLAGEGGVDVCPLIGEIEEWARSIGASEITPIGRFGWKKALVGLGYEANMVIYRKALI